MKNFKAFTLVEVMVCIILTAIVAFFIYTMMLSAHKTYFKLFSVSRQKNDIRYFETLIKRSVSSAQVYELNGNQLIFKYYHWNSASASLKYRVDVYSCGSALKSDATGSNIEDLMGKKNTEIKSSYSGTTDTTIYLTVYEGSSYENAIASTPIMSNEVVMENVNKLFYYKKQISNTTPVWHMAVVYNRTLDDGEVDYEYMIYTICMENLFYME